MTEFMRASDAFTWAMEADPRLRSTVVTLVILDSAPDWGEVRNRFDRISRTLPIFRQRVVPSPAPAPPRWENAPDFDLDFHLRRITAPAPGDMGTLLEAARVAAMEDFDRARPMWKVTMVDGVDDGGAALLCKFHHALTDGVGAIQIAMILFDLTEQASGHTPLPDEPAARRPVALGGYRDALRYSANLFGSAVTGAVKSAPETFGSTVRHPMQTATSAAAIAASVYRTVRPVNETGSPLMKNRSLVRRLAVHDVPLAALRAAAHRGGGALNDAFVAGIAGGLRIYHEKHDIPVADLHLSMPISLRQDDDDMGGNRITLMRFDVCVGQADPAERIARIHERTTAVRHERSLPYTQLIAAGLNLMPRWYIGAILRHVDFLASDVPGVPVPVFLGGTAVSAQYAFGPTVGAAVNVTLLTYVDTCALGIDIDTGAIPDFALFRECLVAGFDEVLALAR